MTPNQDFVGRILLPSLPFVLAALLQAFARFARLTAAGAFDRERKVSPNRAATDLVREDALNAAVVTYRTLTFFLSLLAVGSTSIVCIVQSERKWLALVPAVVLPSMLAAWGMVWQHLTHEELTGPRGREMRIASWAQIFLLWVVTLVTR
jgi:hypothetical protein